MPRERLPVERPLTSIRRSPPLYAIVLSIVSFIALASGCNTGHAPSSPAPAEPGKAAPQVERREKMTLGLHTRFEEPERVDIGVPVPVRLVIRGGPPGETYEVDWVVGPGAQLAHERTQATFDEDGEAVAENAVTLSETEGCLVIAHIRGLDGRTQEAHCVLGTPDEPAEKAKAVELPDGRRVKIDPSR